MLGCCLEYTDPTRPCNSHVRGKVPGRAVYTANCTRPCTCCAQVVYTLSCSGLHGPCSRPVRGHVRAAYTCTQPAYTAVYSPRTRPCTRPCTWPRSRHVQGLVTAVYSACRRPCTGLVHGTLRVHGLYTAMHTIVYMHVYTAPIHGHEHLHSTCTQPCTRPCRRPCTGPSTRPYVYGP